MLFRKLFTIFITPLPAESQAGTACTETLIYPNSKPANPSIFNEFIFCNMF